MPLPAVIIGKEILTYTIIELSEDIMKIIKKYSTDECDITKQLIQKTDIMVSIRIINSLTNDIREARARISGFHEKQNFAVGTSVDVVLESVHDIIKLIKEELETLKTEIENYKKQWLPFNAKYPIVYENLLQLITIMEKRIKILISCLLIGNIITPQQNKYVYW